MHPYTWLDPLRIAHAEPLAASDVFGRSAMEQDHTVVMHDDRGRGSFFEWVDLSPMIVESLDFVSFLKKRSSSHWFFFGFDV